jgi:DUF1365 family protein
MTASALYECRVQHQRYGSRPHRFAYSLFSFALELDELDAVIARLPLLSRNRFNLFSFYDRDHLGLGGADVRSNLETLLRSRGITERPGRVLLLTSLRILGYVFNPVSFFFCFDEEGRPLAAVAEVRNTFGETKPYVIGRDGLTDGRFESTQRKLFYISPFIPLDVDLRLRLAIPGERLGIVIDDLQDGQRIMHASMTGARLPLTTGRLAWFAVKYPLMTVKVIAAIHWQALRLWLKGVPFFRKQEHTELQQGRLGTEAR